ncbi:hypothetical protein ACJJTC_004031 [Scirpophaga incertulas]
MIIVRTMKKYARNQLYDKLHRGGVIACIGLTLYGTVLLGDHFYKYFKYVRPQIQATKAVAEQELLSEVQRLPNSSVPKNISESLEHDIEQPSSSQNDTDFEGTSNELKCFSQNELDDLVRDFKAVNKKSENYIELVEDLLQLKNMGCNMNIKLHFLHSYLSTLPENLGDMSEEQGEPMHQSLRVMEELYEYQGFWNTKMMSHYCWFLVRHFPKYYLRRKTSNDMSCYRPLALMPDFAIVVGNIMYKRFYNLLQSRKILSVEHFNLLGNVMNNLN